MEQFEIKITGKVQGVGFRFFVQHHASQLGIKGWVKNTSDGNVLILAQGGAPEMEIFFNELRKGPPLARIKDITRDKAPVSNEYDGFRVK